MAPSTMSWHGQAEQLMVLRGRSVLAGVPDAQGPPPWTRVARRGCGLQLCRRSRCGQAALDGHAASWSGGHRGMMMWPDPGRLGGVLACRHWSFGE
eukprot:scaffold82500_cov31-Phaeocystis_antarctica.AAC.3